MVSFIAQVAAGGYPGPDPVNVPVSLVVGLAGLALTAWNVVALWRDGRLRAGRREADMSRPIGTTRRRSTRAPESHLRSERRHAAIHLDCHIAGACGPGPSSAVARTHLERSGPWELYRV
jgi:hypothetical protein